MLCSWTVGYRSYASLRVANRGLAKQMISRPHVFLSKSLLKNNQKKSEAKLFFSSRSGWNDNSFFERGPIPSLFYHRSPSTILHPQFKAGDAWAGLLSLTGVNFAILVLWNSQVEEEANGTLKDEDKMRHEDFMLDNFATNLTNFKEGRVWTLLTSSISHQGFAHFSGNMFAMWLFGWPTYRVIGTKAFYGLYAVGGITCSSFHLLHNISTGRTQPPLNYHERKEAERLLTLEQELRMQQGRVAMAPQDEMRLQAAKKRIDHADMPSLGASGSVMAISAVAASLFPLDSVRVRTFLLPLPFAVSLYVMSDLAGVTQQGSGGTDHAGHLGGIAMGLLYVYASWYGKKGSFRNLHALGTRGELPIIFRMKQAFGVPTSTSAAVAKRRGRLKM